MRVLELATTYPKNRYDSQPRFIADFTTAISKDVDVDLLIPSAGRDTLEQGEAAVFELYTFRYFLKSLESLAYGSGIVANLKDKPALILQVPFFLLGFIISTSKRLKAKNYDILHAHWWFPAGLVAVISRFLTKSDTKIVITCHGADVYALQGKFFGWLRRKVFRATDSIVFVSKAMLTDFASDPLVARKSYIGPMGVDMEQAFIPPLSEEATRKNVVFVGRLVEKKGVDVLVKAWKIVRDMMPDLDQNLLIYGEGVEREKIENLIATLELGDSVMLMRPVPHTDLPEILQASKVLVFPSLVANNNDREGLGLVPIEAIGCLCPVIASDIPTMRDLFGDDNNNLFAMADEQDLAKRILDSLSGQSNKEALMKLRTCLKKQFSWGAVRLNYLNIYTTLVNHR